MSLGVSPVEVIKRTENDVSMSLAHFKGKWNMVLIVWRLFPLTG